MSLEDALGKLSLYDAKKYFRKAQNVVFSFTEMESKVREATNNEPWGASSKLMASIVPGTYNYREREEIFGMIFKRFVEKSASEWRQIYKALQLLDYLVKHGSERFIDDVRSNLSLINMLESFHYIDSQGRDQGVNVRNRAKALIELLSDDGLLRAERRKARETSGKFKGVAGGMPSYLPGSSNPSAGFSRSTARGISVSADYDSDEDASYARQSAAKQYEGEYKVEVSSGKKKESISTNIREDDDEEEFTEFQCAPPVEKRQNSTGANPLAELYSATASQRQDIFKGFSLQAPSLDSSHVEPAIVASQSKSDPFGSLLTSAKEHPAKASPPPQASSTSSETDLPSSKVDDDTDDVFGDLKSAPTLSPSVKNNAASEIDLLAL